MADLDDRLAEARTTIDRLDPPSDLWSRAVDRSAASEPRPARRRSPLLVAAAIAGIVALGVGVLAGDDDEQSVDTVPATEQSSSTTSTAPTTTTTPVDPTWGGHVRPPSDVLHDRPWDDPLDVADARADVTHLRYTPRTSSRDGLPTTWTIFFAAAPPPGAAMEPGVVMAYGLVLDTDLDGEADHLFEIDDESLSGDGGGGRWTDLATGETRRLVDLGIELSHPGDEGRRPTSALLQWYALDDPLFDPLQVRFYAWSTVARDGAVVQRDFAPDTGWASNRRAEDR